VEKPSTYLNGVGGEGEGVLGVEADGLGAVAVMDVVVAVAAGAAADVEVGAVGRRARDVGVRGRLGRAEEPLLLPVAVSHARLALHPRRVAAGVEHHREPLLRRAQPDGHHVVARAQAPSAFPDDAERFHYLKKICRSG
jgi:hypothetical protein